MAKAVSKVIVHRVKKSTSIGNGLLKMSSMNKNKKASFKKYRGQGRWLSQMSEKTSAQLVLKHTKVGVLFGHLLR